MQPNKQYTTTSGYNIFIYDDIIPYAYRNQFLHFLLHSSYHVGGKDNGDIDIKSRHMHSTWTDEELNRSLFLQIPQLQPILNEHLAGQKVAKTRVNLCSFSDYNNFHLDEFFGKTLLYYPLHEWDLRWGGLTLFGDDQLKRLEYAVDYVPGRICIFDGNIPHMVQAPTVMAPGYRYTFAIQFVPQEAKASTE